MLRDCLSFNTGDEYLDNARLSVHPYRNLGVSVWQLPLIKLHQREHGY